MPRFRQRPVVVEAVQLTPELAFEVLERRQALPFNLQYSSAEWHSKRGTVASFFVRATNRYAGLHDWLVRPIGAQGFQALTADEFAATYEEEE